MENSKYEVVVDDKPAEKDIVVSIVDCAKNDEDIDIEQLELINFAKAVGAPMYLMNEELPEEKEVEEKK